MARKSNLDDIFFRQNDQSLFFIKTLKLRKAKKENAQNCCLLRDKKQMNKNMKV